jgi:Flp pilus assembly protein TadD
VRTGPAQARNAGVLAALLSVSGVAVVMAATPTTLPAPDEVVLDLRGQAGAVAAQRNLAGSAVRDAAAATQYADAQSALTAATDYYARAQAERDTRFLGRAEAVLAPWVGKADVVPGVLVMQARLLQQRHRFLEATAVLDRVLTRSPGDADARLLRASVLLTRGEFERARVDCRHLMADSEFFAGTVCLAQVMAGTGALGQAGPLLDGALARLPATSGRSDPGVRAQISWAHGVRAELFERSGDDAAAESELRAALELEPSSELLRLALVELLIVRGAVDEAAQLADLPRPSPAVLVRQLQIERLQRGDMRDGVRNGVAAVDSAPAGSLRTQLDELLELGRLRGERLHLREEAQLALYVDRDACRALGLAEQNLAVQREFADVRLLAAAARECRRPDGTAGASGRPGSAS